MLESPPTLTWKWSQELQAARTLLERTGAKVSFTNRPFPDHGAVVQIVWPRERFEEAAPTDETEA